MLTVHGPHVGVGFFLHLPVHIKRWTFRRRFLSSFRLRPTYLAFLPIFSQSPPFPKLNLSQIAEIAKGNHDTHDKQDKYTQDKHHTHKLADQTTRTSAHAGQTRRAHVSSA